MKNDFSHYLDTIGEFGIVDQIHHPIATVKGLPLAKPHEIVLFETGQFGEVFSLDKDQLDILVFSADPVRAGTRLVRTGKTTAIPIGKELLGKVVNPLSDLLFPDPAYIPPKEEREIDIAPPGISKRSRIKKTFQTGVAVVDMMIPLGKGQRQLVLGDRKTGKSSFLLAALKNQILEGSIAIYCAIGKKKSDIKKLEDFFIKEKIIDRVIIVATSSYDSPSLIFLTPYSGITIAEYFRDLGQDAVVVFDDLSTHAKFYREISLIARKFPGRDSYPGDIFYTHARLLERAGNFSHPEKGDVSITSLPVVETIEGDLTGYITTNIMGMTDGHIFFDSNLYYKGRRPAINIPLSVTRVGRQTQEKFKRDITRELTSFLTIYDKMENLSHFGAELTESVKNILGNGEAIYEFFEQQSTYIIPNQIQFILFAMIWLKFFTSEELNKLPEIKYNLIQGIKNPQTEQFFDTILKTDSFNGLLGNVSINKDALLALCSKNQK